MSRWIDADALEYDTEWDDYHDGFTAYSQLQIDTAPSINIVRCKECKHWYKHDNFTGKLCLIGEAITKPNDYCSYGEREGE